MGHQNRKAAAKYPAAAGTRQGEKGYVGIRDSKRTHHPKTDGLEEGPTIPITKILDSTINQKVSGLNCFGFLCADGFWNGILTGTIKSLATNEKR
jgi:hypothetical protein